ncbi:UNVERIFIED_CONTAM: hypothetical protein PYX00_007616 [Menopon gallinae]|uniref:Uncharacterized protein n=1 Tax=Menopon gallinae TaxID=328185 RepID=A0AAW2HJN1_9NEOP
MYFLVDVSKKRETSENSKTEEKVNTYKIKSNKRDDNDDDDENVLRSEVREVKNVGTRVNFADLKDSTIFDGQKAYSVEMRVEEEMDRSDTEKRAVPRYFRLCIFSGPGLGNDREISTSCLEIESRVSQVVSSLRLADLQDLRLPPVHWSVSNIRKAGQVSFYEL